MEHDSRLTIFWIVHLIMLGLFALEVLFILSVWLRSRVPGVPAEASRWRKLGAAAGIALGIVFSRRIWTLLRSLLVDGMVHQRLYQKNVRRWLAHIMVFGSFLLLGILSTITGVVVEFLPLFGMSPEQAASLPLIGQTFHADVWWVALVNELLGLVVLAGMILIIVRRYVAKDPQLRTITADHIMISLLTLVAVGGFLAETFRLLADYTTPAGLFAPDPSMLSPDKFPAVLIPTWGPQWGFLGYALAWLFGLLKIGPETWAVLHNLFFWLHFAVVTALLYYLPFSRFIHIIMSPVIVAYNTMLEREGRNQHKPTEQKAPQAAA
jgi:nitrate reductase gamma subunit